MEKGGRGGGEAGESEPRNATRHGRYIHLSSPDTTTPSATKSKRHRCRRQHHPAPPLPPSLPRSATDGPPPPDRPPPTRYRQSATPPARASARQPAVPPRTPAQNPGATTVGRWKIPRPHAHVHPARVRMETKAGVRAKKHGHGVRNSAPSPQITAPKGKWVPALSHPRLPPHPRSGARLRGRARVGAEGARRRRWRGGGGQRREGGGQRGCRGTEGRGGTRGRAEGGRPPPRCRNRRRHCPPPAAATASPPTIKTGRARAQQEARTGGLAPGRHPRRLHPPPHPRELPPTGGQRRPLWSNGCLERGGGVPWARRKAPPS